MATNKNKKETKKVSNEILNKESKSVIETAKAKKNNDDDLKPAKKTIIEEAESFGKKFVSHVAEPKRKIELKDEDADQGSKAKNEDITIPAENRVTHKHNPIHWRAANDLIVKVDPQVKYIGSVSKIGQVLPKKDQDAAVYETTEEQSVLTSNILTGKVFSAPEHLSNRFKHGDIIVFDSKMAKAIDYNKGFMMAPAHSVIGYIDFLNVVDLSNGQDGEKVNKNGSKKFKVRGNIIGRIIQGIRVRMGRANVS